VALERRGQAVSARLVEVLAPGTLTTVQDWPGRLGHWDVGVPPSGPMDDRSFRIGNRLLGNPQGAAGLEITLTGPRLRFRTGARVTVTGAPLAVTLDDRPAPQWTVLDVRPGTVLKLGAIRGVGMRAYVLFDGGLAGPPTMGSRAVFALARLGGRSLHRGDTLMVAAARRPPVGVSASGVNLANEQMLRIVAGPQGAPEFLTDDGLRRLLEARWSVHHHSDRTGIRLVGARPQWARADGGEAGLHPSNILDSAYSVGTVMLAGDMAVIVGPDGPSLGGFISVGQVIRADRWRLGQLRAGDCVRLRAVSVEQAMRLHAQAEAEILRLEAPGRGPDAPPPTSADSCAPGRHGAALRVQAPALRRAISIGESMLDRPCEGAHGSLVYRRAGESALLVEFGEPRLDLRSRVRVQALLEALCAESLDGLGAVTPGVRSLHVQYRPERVTVGALVDTLRSLERGLTAPELMTIPGRAVHLPLSWRHSEVARAVERYRSSVRADAPWCPDNIDFIRRINGLPDERAVHEIVFAASYLVLGLGDVYLGAPVAVPLDPRHRLVSTKYNPARTWTPANAVGIGGALLCVYGIEGPGGYQLVGRTVPVWHHAGEPPWRLRHFDQLRFEPVAEEELEELRAASDAGRWSPRIERADFSLAEAEREWSARALEIAAFRARRQAAFEAEREAWHASEEMLAVGS
jgi:urea carboxylase